MFILEKKKTQEEFNDYLQLLEIILNVIVPQGFIFMLLLSQVVFCNWMILHTLKLILFT